MVAGSSINSGTGPAAGIMGDVIYGDKNTVYVNNYSFAREDLATTCALLDTHEPSSAYNLFRQESKPEYRRLILRTIPVPRAVQFLKIMAEGEGGLRDCAEHLGPMDSPHALANPAVNGQAAAGGHPVADADGLCGTATR